MTLSALGIFSAAGAGGDLPAFELIATSLVATNGTDVVFTSVPSTYKHLQVRFTTRSSTTSVSDTILRLNEDDGANYAWHELQGNGSTVASFANTSQTLIRIATQPASTQTNIFAAGVVDILDYASTTKNKTVRVLAGNTSTDRRIQLYSGVRLSTPAITTVRVGGPLGSNSRVSLYGIKG
jgi:hypothetical protein